MTSDESHHDGCTIRRGTGRSAASRLVADGGTPRSQLFHTFPHPLVYYETNRDTAVVRAVNSAFERTFDVEGAAITDDRLVDHLLVDTADGEPDARWIFVDATDESVLTGDTGEPNTKANVKNILASLDEGETVTVGFRRGANGEQHYFRLESVPPSNGDTGGYIVYTRVTNLERQVQNLRMRVDRLERVASVTAHDLQNPLDVAKIRLEAARDTGEDVHFEKVEGALDRIQWIVEDVLSVGGGEVDPSDAVALNDIAEAAWSTVETADATLVLEDDLPTLEADADNLQQLFENLFRNAVEHGRRDVTVTVGSLTDGFYVADDGPGLSSTDRDRAFEPGYSTKGDDSGLGLTIVQRIAEAHGWEVALGSSEDDGARFEFDGIEVDEHA